MDLSGLNDAQRAAVTAPPGPHLVIAGAGTGKTRTLVHRVAWLIDQGAAPRSIVLLTFTRRAATEMLDRAAALVGPKARAVRGGTFHSFGHSLLRRHAPLLGWSEQFTILDRGDAETLVGQLRAELDLGGGKRRFPRARTLLGLYSKAENTGVPLADLLERDLPQYAQLIEPIERLRAHYAARKKDRDLFDYDDLLTKLAQLLREHPAARQAIVDRCHHVLVDEYQDTNRIQGFIAAMLSRGHGDLMVVGDEAQSIYAFRGATVQNILGFPRLFPKARQTRLEHNYRSVQLVLDLANGVLQTATEVFDKRLVSERDGERPLRLRCTDEDEQADHVVRSVLQAREEGVELSQMAVLFRSSHHANALELALTDAGIPTVRYGGMRFTEAAHIKDVVAVLRVLLNPLDELGWLRLLPWHDRVGPKTAARLVAHIVGPGEGRLRPEALQRVRAKAALLELDARLEGLRGQPPGVQLAEVVDWYSATHLPQLHPDDHPKRARDLESLLGLGDRYDTLEELLGVLALDPPAAAHANPDDTEDEQLVLSTVHSAKGLEWRHVTIIGLLDGSFPSGYALDDPAAMEEERRLFYVAVTRAQERLTLVCPDYGRRSQRFIAGPGCALLDDIPDVDGLVENQRHRPAVVEGEEGSAGGSRTVLEDEVAALADFFGL
jgi:DNA helicase-2/ATP-dependent DNA helicase PcrA